MYNAKQTYKQTNVQNKANMCCKFAYVIYIYVIYSKRKLYRIVLYRSVYTLKYTRHKNKLYYMIKNEEKDIAQIYKVIALHKY